MFSSYKIKNGTSIDNAMAQSARSLIPPQKSMSAFALEKKAELSPGTIRKILLGRSKNPSLSTLTAVAKVLDCLIGDLVEEAPPIIPSLDKITIDQKSFPWNANAFLKALSLVEEDLKKRKYRPNLDEILFFTKEIYAYSLGDTNQVVDEKFAHWLIEKNIKIY